MLMTYTGRRPLAMPLSKDLSTLLSRVLPALVPPHSGRASPGTGRPPETLSTRRGPPGLAAGPPSRGGPRQASPAPYPSGPPGRFGPDVGPANAQLRGYLGAADGGPL